MFFFGVFYVFCMLTLLTYHGSHWNVIFNRIRFRGSSAAKSFGQVELLMGQLPDTIVGSISPSSFFAQTMARPGCSVSIP